MAKCIKCFSHCGRCTHDRSSLQDLVQNSDVGKELFDTTIDICYCLFFCMAYFYCWYIVSISLWSGKLTVEPFDCVCVCGRSVAIKS